MRFANVPWPENHENALRAFLAERAGSFIQITALINAQLGMDYSRNAVIGKAKRMGLTSHNPPGGSFAKGKTKPKPQPVARIVTKRASPAPPPEPAVLRCVEVTPRNLTLHELTDETCKWPVTDGWPPHLFCGNPVCVEGKPYCGPHEFLAHRGG